MPTEADIRNAAQRIQDGTGIVDSILQTKQAAIAALKSGNMAKLKKAGSTTFSFNATSL